jgi:shikimate kinase
VQQMPKYSHLDYDNVIKQYDQDSVANIIKKEESNGWKCDNQGNIIGIINQREVA